jgi:hypothetical protein
MDTVMMMGSKDSTVYYLLLVRLVPIRRKIPAPLAPLLGVVIRISQLEIQSGRHMSIDQGSAIGRVIVPQSVKVRTVSDRHRAYEPLILSIDR